MKGKTLEALLRNNFENATGIGHVHDLVVVVHCHNARSTHRPADGDRIRHGGRVRSAPTFRAGAENERKPCKGEGPDEDTVCREWHRPGSETGGRSMNPPRQ